MQRSLQVSPSEILQSVEQSRLCHCVTEILEIASWHIAHFDLLKDVDRCISSGIRKTKPNRHDSVTLVDDVLIIRNRARRYVLCEQCRGTGRWRWLRRGNRITRINGERTCRARAWRAYITDRAG